MTSTVPWTRQTVLQDLTAGLVVFLVALPLCLGIALASEAPIVSGLISGVVGGIVVGFLSRSQTSVAGPAAGLTAVVAMQIASLGSFEAFLLVVVIAGVLQILVGLCRGGFLAEFIPTSVINGLLASIGIILILKQLPHLVGDDTDPEGDMGFRQPDQENTFTEMGHLISDAHLGVVVIGLVSLAVLVLWDRIKPLKNSLVPAPLVVVVLGVMLAEWFARLGGDWAVPPAGLVQVPTASSVGELMGLLRFPAFAQWQNPSIYFSAVVIMLVASLETLLNVEAVDRLDPRRRVTPPSWELVAQGVGNVASGLIGGIPVTSVIVRSSVNINAGGQTQLATIVHGCLLVVAATLLPWAMNRIPLSCLAAFLLVTGFKLASPKLFQEMWKDGKSQFLPFVTTVVAIVLTDLLIGVLIGLGTSLAFILHSNLRRPLYVIDEGHLRGNLSRLILAPQVSFLNRAVLKRQLDSYQPGEHVLIDGRSTDYLDPDVRGLLRHFAEEDAPARGVQVSLKGFRKQLGLPDLHPDIDNSDEELQQRLTPGEVLEILKTGHQRFRRGERLSRDLGHEVLASANGQFPLAVILSCIDSRAPAELIFDVGVGDVFNVRIAGHVTREKVLACLEYACVVVGTKLIVVMGHTKCGAVNAAVDLYHRGVSAHEATGCEHLDMITSDIQLSIDPSLKKAFPNNNQGYVDEIARRHVLKTMSSLRQKSQALDRMVEQDRIAIVGCLYNVASGDVDFFNEA